MADYLIESALLTHGLPGVSDEQLIVNMQGKQPVVWVEKGEVHCGSVSDFVRFRRKYGRGYGYGSDALGDEPGSVRGSDALNGGPGSVRGSDVQNCGMGNACRRINYFNFDRMLETGATGALTASGTMRVCEQMGIPLVVTCGIGGLNQGMDIGRSNDLKALSRSRVSMVATAFKDMFDTSYSLDQARQNGIRIMLRGSDRGFEPGYLFRLMSGDCADKMIMASERMDSDRKEDLNGTHKKTAASEEMPENCGHDSNNDCGILFLNPIKPGDRIGDMNILEEAVRYGNEKQAAEGAYFHPAVNAGLDELTTGRSSEIQLKSLLNNILWAESMDSQMLFPSLHIL